MARPPILRPRLLGDLAGRFMRRCTIISAGAGFGKTTLLEQAIEQNQLTHHGTDLYLRCLPKDRFAEAFGARLNRLVDAPPQEPPVRALSDWIWQRSPEPVVLILDDVHHLPENSSSAEMIEELLSELPMNGHLLLCGRIRPPISMSRLRAQNDLLELGEDQLAFDEDETQRFLAERQISAKITADGIGWPALLELRAVAGGDEVIDYLLDEVLDHLDEDRRRALARLSRLEIIDDDAIGRLGEASFTARELAGDLPLTRILEGGRVLVHSLWRPALTRLPGANDHEVLRATAEFLRERDEVEAALVLLLEIDDHEAVTELLRDLVQTQSRILGSEALRAILAQLPTPLRDSAHGVLLDGLTMFRDDPERALPQLSRAAELLHEVGDRDGEIRALIAQGHLAYFRGDVARLFELSGYARKLADQGYVAALPLALVADAVGALVRSEPEEALELIDRARSIATIEGVPDFMVAVLASHDAGFPERAVAEAERAVGLATPEIRGAVEVSGLGARWQCGHFKAADLESIRVSLTPDTNDSVHNLAVHLAVMTQVAASLGANEIARDFEARCQKYIDRSFDGRAQLCLAIGRAALDISIGDEDSAARHLQEVFDADCLLEKPNRHVLRGIALFYMLVPDARERIDDLELAGIWTLGREVGRALVSLREDGDPAPAAALDWRRPERIGPFVVPSLLTELNIAASTGGGAPPSLHEELGGEIREWLRRVTLRGPDASRRLARTLLTELPITPRSPIEIRLLGSLELRRDGVLVDDSDWRRSRVRALLLYLVAHPGCRREEAGTALWPEHDHDSVGNNLRVNLHHLMRVLQPERRGSEHHWFVRQEGDRLWVAPGEYLKIDAFEFDRACSEGWAANDSAIPALALRHFEEAIELYRGDYCGEADDLPSTAPERTRLRSQFARAAQRAGELLLAKGEMEPVLVLVSRVLQHDPFSQRAYCLQARTFIMMEDHASARQSLEYGLKQLRDEGLEPNLEIKNLASELNLA